MEITLEILEKVGIKQENAQKYIDFINQNFKTFNFSRENIIHFLSQCIYESNWFTEIEENMNYSAERLLEVFPTHFNEEEAQECAHNPQKIANKVYGGRYGNNCVNDGWLYRGKGLIQITFKNEYLNVGNFSGVSDQFVKNPDMLLQPRYAVLSAFGFWKMKNINQFNKVDELNCKIVTEKVNGGLNGFSERLKLMNQLNELISE